METSLHKQLKLHYSDDRSAQEFRLGDFRVDVLRVDTKRGDELIEIQHGSLAAIRDKVRRLLKSHRVLVVKPLIVEKVIVRCQAKGGRVVCRRKSPKRGRIIDFFDEFVYFVKLFPNPNLTIETILVDVEEWRYPGHGRRRRWRHNDFQVEDQRLTAIHETRRFATRQDLLSLIPPDLSATYDTAELASVLSVQRWMAQRIAYCLRETGAAVTVGKQGNARLYRNVA